MDLGEKLKAIELAAQHGAAMVYHDVVAVETDVHKWMDSHPGVAALLGQGITMATDWLKGHGIPVDQIEIGFNDVLAYLRQLAAQDASISSISP